jgi:hypothetical protein
MKQNTLKIPDFLRKQPKLIFCLLLVPESVFKKHNNANRRPDTFLQRKKILLTDK